MHTSSTNSRLTALIVSLASIGSAERLSAQEPSTPPSVPRVSPSNSESLNLLSVPKPLRLDSGTKPRTDLPKRVVSLAEKAGIDLSDIEYKDKQWVVCDDTTCRPLIDATPEEIARYAKPRNISGLAVGDELQITGHRYATHMVEDDSSYGIPDLGRFVKGPDGSITFTPDDSFRGTVSVIKKTQVDTKSLPAGIPRAREIAYTAAELKKLGDELRADLDTDFVLVISVPSECPPCRLYKGDIRQAASTARAGDTSRFVTVNFKSFEEARSVMGVVKLFPTTVFYPSIDEQSREGEKPTNRSRNPLFLESIKRPGFTVEGRLSVDLIKRTLEKTRAAVRKVSPLPRQTQP